METTNGKPAPDWERIEADYRAGLLSIREIAAKNGITDTAIRKRAKKSEWVRDLAAKIAARADDLVRKEEVRREVRAQSAIPERDIVEANAGIVAGVHLSHRRDIPKARSITMRLLEELELQSGRENAELLEQLGELMRREDDRGQDKLNDLYQKIISLPGRAKTMKDLGESLRVLVTLERQAFGLDNAGPDGEAQGGPTKQLTDAERAVRLSRLMSGNPEALAVFLAKVGGNGA